MKNKEHEWTTRTRIGRLIRMIADRPNGYTRKELADRLGVSVDTIGGDLEALRNAGYTFKADERHRYAFVVDQPMKQLKNLLHFTEEDQLLLYQAIESLPMTTDRHQNLKKKLASIYDYGRLGHSYLRKPYLNKVDLLQDAIARNKCVKLIGYRSSNSNTVQDRIVEPFHISPPDDTLQTYEPSKQKSNHFRISRIHRVEVLDLDWQHEGHHNIRHTDPFRIVSNELVNVHLRLSIGAYNELTERFPSTLNHIMESETEGIYDFQGPVNSQFLGLANFILGFYHQGIEILYPDSLRTHLKKVVLEMKF